MLNPNSLHGRGSALASLTLGLVACGTPCAATTNAATDDVWAMPESVAATDVADELRIDGASTRVRVVHSAAPPAEVLAAWRRLWDAPPLRGASARAGSWQVISRPVDAGMLTLQIRAAEGGGTIGYLALQSVGRTNGSHAAVGPAGSVLRLPASSVVLRSVESRDGSRAATQTVVRLPTREDAAMRAFAGAAEAAGWVERFDDALRPRSGRETSAHGSASARWFVRGREELTVFATREGRGALVVLDHVRPQAHTRGGGR